MLIDDKRETILKDFQDLEYTPIPKLKYQYDFATITRKNITVIAGGGIRVKGTMCSSGWLEYRLPDGSVQLQWVPFETLTDSEHLDALKGMVLTLLHPNESVSPESYKTHTVGSVLSITPNKVSQQLDCELAINDIEAIEAVVKGRITDLSCGYQVNKELIKDNKWKQVKRIPNHLSLVPAGRDAKAQLHLDSATLILNEPVTPSKPLSFVSYIC